MVQEPRFAILLIFFEGNSEGIGNVHGLAAILPEENADDAFVGCSSRGACMVVCDGKKDQRVHDYS